VGTSLIHADGRTDMVKLIGALAVYATVPNECNARHQHEVLMSKYCAELGVGAAVALCSVGWVTVVVCT
jgi:hypothetical protein